MVAVSSSNGAWPRNCAHRLQNRRQMLHIYGLLKNGTGLHATSNTHGCDGLRKLSVDSGGFAMQLHPDSDHCDDPSGAPCLPQRAFVPACSGSSGSTPPDQAASNRRDLLAKISRFTMGTVVSCSCRPAVPIGTLVRNGSRRDGHVSSA